MATEEILNEYPYILKTMKELNCELNQIIRSKELMENTLKSEHESKYCSLDPTLQAVERVLDRYENNISYITERINELKELKSKLDKTL